jgi:SAM-dependent methyltransferase
MTGAPVNAHAKSEIFQETTVLNPTPQTAIAPNFNRLARIYRWLEYLTFGPFLWRCRIHFLPQLLCCRRALVLGDGDGRFTVRLLRENPEIQIHAVDASPRMIEALQRASKPYAARLTTEVADLRIWGPANSVGYDLIVTHFFLDCLSTDEVSGLACRLTPALCSNALWVVSEFAIPSTVFGRTFAAGLVTLLYRVFRLLTGLRQQSLPNHFGALRTSGWALQIEDTHLCGLLLGQLWRFDLPSLESHRHFDSST